MLQYGLEKLLDNRGGSSGVEPSSSGVEPVSSGVEPGSSSYVDPLSSGLVLYAPLSSAASSAVTGQPIVSGDDWDPGRVNYVGLNGIPCLEETQIYNLKLTNIASDTISSGTVTFWAGVSGVTGEDTAYLLCVCPSAGANQLSSGWNFTLADETDKPSINVGIGRTYDTGEDNIRSIPNLTMHFFTVTFTDSATTLYVDKQQINYAYPPAVTNCVGSGFAVYLGHPSNSWDTDVKRYMAALRIYDRVLSAEEIALLSSEFTPNSSLSVDSNFTWTPADWQYLTGDN